MLNLLDDCSRLFTGSKIYERELLLSLQPFSLPIVKEWTHFEEFAEQNRG